MQPDTEWSSHCPQLFHTALLTSGLWSPTAAGSGSQKQQVLFSNVSSGSSLLTGHHCSAVMSPLSSTGIPMTCQNVPLVSTAGPSWPLLADWQDKAWLSRVMASEESFGLAVSKEKAGEANELSALYFSQKLWKLVESDQFQSIRWSLSGKCVAINEELFKEEVLGRAGPLQVFALNSMKSFLRQMNLYGFTKLKSDVPRSASLPEFLREEPADSQILYYYNPSFNRDHPHLLESCKRRVGVKWRASDAPAVDESHPSMSPGGQPAGDTPAPTKQWAPPSLTSVPPPPPAAAPTLPQPAGAAGSQRLIPLTLFFLPPPSSQAPEGLQPHAQAPLCFPVPVLAAASALLGPRPPHCPTCTPNPADGHGTS
ncbi:PREDICTED: heat shock transcription factor, X-linked-like [Calidris pugnax]|uniref:heat shock transcription factor, X-linked-like n=1 Tax=Calidris pugnax TaxID=198806 RepID=UPI00071C87BA|nr:PREDICTED: heat shock transcription factor, X-linked-like [Calidris pugnax]XP_014814943.1 PREDICTED: heat shock transcription factor, X-linked-like [Calidris pugnax]